MKMLASALAIFAFSATAATINELAPNELGVQNDFWNTKEREALEVSQDEAEDVSCDGRIATSAACALESFDSCWFTRFVSEATDFQTGGVGFLLFLR